MLKSSQVSLPLVLMRFRKGKWREAWIPLATGKIRNSQTFFADWSLISKWLLRHNKSCPVALLTLFPCEHSPSSAFNFPLNFRNRIQRPAKKCANLAKQDPARAKLKSQARTARNFSRPRTIFLADLCRYQIVLLSHFCGCFLFYPKFLQTK